MPRLSKCCVKIPQRWVTVVVGFVVFLNVYGMRTCLSITITEMTLPPNRTDVFSNDSCSQNLGNTNVTHMKHPETPTRSKYNWDERTQGLILSSFYLGHVTTNLFSGFINRKFGSKHSISFSILCTAIFTLLTPCCTTWGGSTGLIVVRLAMGITEGFVQASLIGLVAHWIPEDERSKAGAVLYSALPLGAIFGMLPSGIIMQHSNGDWRLVFYFFGILGLVAFLLNIAFCYNSPSDSPFISAGELNYLKNTLKNTHSKLPSAPWRRILKSRPVWVLIVAMIGQMYGVVVSTSDMPKYMSRVLRLSVQKNGYLSSIPHLSMLVTGNAFSWAADRLIAKKTMSIAAVRKIGCAVASFGCAAFLIAAVHAGCDGTLVTVLLSMSSCCLGGVFFSTSINALDLSPNFASTITGMLHGISTVAGMLAPYVIGVMTPNQTLNEWRSAFWVVFGLMVTSSVVFLIYASGEVQEWNDPEFLNRKRPANENGVKESVDLLHKPE